MSSAALCRTIFMLTDDDWSAYVPPTFAQIQRRDRAMRTET